MVGRKGRRDCRGKARAGRRRRGRPHTGAAYNPRMLDALKALAERSVMERLVLLVNHVIATEPVAVARLQPHAGRTVHIELAGWPQLLPAAGPFTFRITPAGLVERVADGAAATPDLRVAFDAA